MNSNPGGAPQAAGGAVALNAQAGKLPASLAFGLAIGAAILGTVVDYVFEMVGLGGYLWYLATAVVFGSAGFGAAFLPSATKNSAMMAMVAGAALYAVLTIVLYAVVFGAAGAGVGLIAGIIAGAINFGIGSAAGVGGVYRGAQMRSGATGQ